MKRNLSYFVLLLVSLFAICFLPVGCRLFDNNPGAPDPANLAGLPAGSPQSVGTAQSVSFRVVLPAMRAESDLASAASDITAISQNPGIVAAIRASTGTSTPTVTFKLTLLNIGNTTNPTFTLVKTVAADASGTAMATFESVPALTCIGDISIQGGSIASFTEFHGATDLLAGQENAISVSPKNSGTRHDVIASIIEKLIADTGYTSKIIAGLASRVSAAISELDLSTVTIDQAYIAFLTFTTNMPMIQTTETTTISVQNIPSSGGTITVASPGSSLDGLEITVPSGAFDGGANVTVTIATIASYSLGVDFTPATPLILIESGGELANEPVSVKIPISISDDEFAMAYQFDPITGRLVALAPIDTSVESFQVVTSSLGKSAPMAGMRGLVRSTLLGSTFGSTTGIVVKKTKKSDILPVDLINTGFQPGVNDWAFHNYGSYIAPGGHCDGQSLTAMWYYTYIQNPNLFGLFDNNGQYDKTGIGKTPTIEFDDVLAYKFASVCHNDNAFRISKLLGTFESWAKGDAFTFLYFKDAMKTTGQPQLVGLYGKNGKGESKAHAVLAYKATSSELYIADPNKPGATDLKILFTVGFQPYLSSEKADEEQISYDRIRFIGNNSNLDLQKMAQRWGELENGSIGKTYFPEYKLNVKNDDGSISPLTEGFRTIGTKIVVQGEINSNDYKTTDFIFWVWNQTNFVSAGSPTVTIPLSVGENKIGLWIRATPPGESEPQWLDFKWLTVYCDAQAQPPLINSVGPSPLYGVNGSQIKITLIGNNFETGMIASVTWKDDQKILDSSQVRVESPTKAAIFINFGAIADTWWISLKNQAGLESQPFSFQVSEPVGAVADGFDYPIGNRRFQTERKTDQDGWFNATRFGEYYPVNGKYHLGSDWNGDGGASKDMDEPVYAAADGVVSFARNADGLVSGWGNVVIIRHQIDTGTSNMVVESLYGHLKTINITSGIVKRGDVIGTLGDGSVDGSPSLYPEQAHLHFAIRNILCGQSYWGWPDLGYSVTPKPTGWEDPIAFIDAHRPSGTVAPPPAPLNVKATAGDGQVSVTWAAAPGATSYVVYRATKTITYDLTTGTDTTTTAKAAPTNSATLTGLTNGNEYHIVVTSLGANGESQWSSEVTATPKVTTTGSDYTSANIGTLKYVPAGTFQRDATPANTSYVSAFRMSQHEITRAQFLAIMGTDPSTSYSSGMTAPVQQANWYHAIAFCNKLSIAEGRTPAYAVTGVNFSTLTFAAIPTSGDNNWNTATCNWSADGYRLPAEMEWMWAAMGADQDSGSGAMVGGVNVTGYAKPFAGSNGSNAVGDYSWYYTNSSSGSKAVGTKLVNELGLYDMSGNVWEWCWDWYSDNGTWPYYAITGAVSDYRGAETGSNRVIRGGGWNSSADDLTAAYRLSSSPGNQNSHVGFRVVRP